MWRWTIRIQNRFLLIKGNPRPHISKFVSTGMMLTPGNECTRCTVHWEITLPQLFFHIVDSSVRKKRVASSSSFASPLRRISDVRKREEDCNPRTPFGPCTLHILQYLHHHQIMSTPKMIPSAFSSFIIFFCASLFFSQYSFIPFPVNRVIHVSF